MDDTTQYNTTDFQKTLINFMISDNESFIRVQNIIDDSYFSDPLRPVIRMIKNHADTYNSVPLPQQVKAMTGYQPDILEGISESDVAWFLTSTDGFCRHRAIENVIHKGPDILQKGQGGDLERMIKEAMTISLISDLGTSYFENVRERIERRRDRSNYVSSGWETLDRKLGGGFTRGSLNIFAGGSGSGKSLFLQNIALNWAIMGMNVIYITLELSEDLVNERLDAMVSQYKTSDIQRNIDAVCLKIANAARGIGGVKSGDLKVKKMSEAGTTANDIKAYLKEYQIKEGRKPDGLIIDYLDLMHPNSAKIDSSNLFTKDKYVSEEMRSIGGELDIPVVSASQLNRSSVEAQEYDPSHIAGGLSKLNSCDNFFALFTSLTMRENGKYQLQFLKTRSAAAVGHKIDLAYDPSCMRISDMIDVPSIQPTHIPAPSSSGTILTTTPTNVSQNSGNPISSSGVGSVRTDLQNLMDKYKRDDA